MVPGTCSEHLTIARKGLTLIEFLTVENGIALLTLTALEIVLRIDNIVFISPFIPIHQGLNSSCTFVAFAENSPTVAEASRSVMHAHAGAWKREDFGARPALARNCWSEIASPQQHSLSLQHR